MDMEKMLKDAAVYAADGKLCGHHAIGPDGQLVLAKGLGLAASVERGVYIDGLKDGWKLGSEADVKRKKAEGEALDKAAAKAVAVEIKQA